MRTTITCLILALCILLPGIAAAQETTEPAPTPTTWRLYLSRSIIWMGDSITAVVNGTANVTVTIQLRPWNASAAAYGNYSLSETKRTDRNGTAVFILETDDLAEWGNYTLVALVNSIAVARAVVTINYDPIRWLEILIERNEAHDAQQDIDIQTGVTRDSYILDKMERYLNLVIVVCIIFVAYFLITIELYLNYHNYKRRKAGKKSRLLWLMSDANVEFFQGGGVIYDKPPVLPDTVNGEDVSPYGFTGMNTRQIIEAINGRMKGVKTTIRKMDPSERERPRWLRRKERKEIRAELGDKREAATYLDICKESE